MADNVAITAGSGTNIASDEIAGVHYQRLKVTWGPDGTANDADVASGKPLPVQLRDSNGTDVGLSTKVGATNESAPATDTAASGLNGRLQRIAQNITSSVAAVSTYHLITAATTNANNIKSSAGALRSVHVYNNASYPVYVKFHNTAGTPTAGTGVVFTVGVQAGTQRELVLSRGGRSFGTGIGITVVKDIADAGATAVALNDASVEVCYD